VLFLLGFGIDAFFSNFPLITATWMRSSSNSATQSRYHSLLLLGEILVRSGVATRTYTLMTAGSRGFRVVWCVLCQPPPRCFRPRRFVCRHRCSGNCRHAPGEKLGYDRNITRVQSRLIWHARDHDPAINLIVCGFC
jgi:hypothetical protein